MSRMTAALIVTLALCGALFPVATAQDKTFVLRAARLFDGREIRTPGLVVVSGAAIVGVGPSSQTPPDAQVNDLGDATLSPGFVDAHTHLSGMYTVDYRDNIVDSVV